MSQEKLAPLAGLLDQIQSRLAALEGQVGIEGPAAGSAHAVTPASGAWSDWTTIGVSPLFEYTPLEMDQIRILRPFHLALTHTSF